MINQVKFMNDMVIVNYSLENGGYKSLNIENSVNFTIQQVRELPLNSEPCIAKPSGGWSWIWYEDIVILEDLGLRFVFHVTETSDDFYDESVEIFHYDGQHCNGITMSGGTSGRMFTPPHQNSVWVNPIYEDKRDLSSPLDSSPIIIPSLEPKQIIMVNDTIKEYLAKHPEKLYNVLPREFEKLIAEILKDLGFTEVMLTPATRDGGFDIYAYMKNQVTSFLTLVECKRWAPENKVGIDVVQRVFGAAKNKGAHKCMIVTTSFFSKPAQNESRRVSNEMELKDFNDLKIWFQRYNK